MTIENRGRLPSLIPHVLCCALTLDVVGHYSIDMLSTTMNGMTAPQVDSPDTVQAEARGSRVAWRSCQIDNLGLPCSVSPDRKARQSERTCSSPFQAPSVLSPKGPELPSGKIQPSAAWRSLAGSAIVPGAGRRGLLARSERHT